METKICSKCKVTLSLGDFVKNKSKKIGYNSECKSCQKIYRENNREKVLESKKIHYQNNREKVLESKKIYRENNREKVLESQKIHYQNNREKVLESQKIWRENNPEKKRSASAKRRSKKLKATPPWFDEFEKNKVDSIYRQVKELELEIGESFQVDHVHPLNHHLVCGLHVSANLQILTATENLSKSNKFESYVESELDPNNLNSWEKI